MNVKVLGSAIVGILLVVIAVVYFIEPAKNLPAFFPGHDATLTKTHFKHGIAALAAALCLFAFAWFNSGKKKTASAEHKEE